MPKVLDSFLSKKERDIIMAGVDKLTHDDLFYTEAEQQEWDDWERNSIEEDIRNRAKKEGHREGHREGHQLGLQQGIKETIIAMHENDATLEFISKVTGKTIQEIQEILKNK